MENNAISWLDDQKMFDSAVEKIKECSILEISSWNGLRYPNHGGIIITNNRTVYEYQFFGIIPIKAKPEDFTFIRKLKELSQEEYSKITSFIESKIIDKEFQDRMMRDSGSTLIVNYNGIRKEINNNSKNEGESGIYDEAKQLISEVLDRTEK